jgi:hypothetical protein
MSLPYVLAPETGKVAEPYGSVALIENPFVMSTARSQGSEPNADPVRGYGVEQFPASVRVLLRAKRVALERFYARRGLVLG